MDDVVKKLIFLMIFAFPLQAEEPWSVNPECPTLVKPRSKTSHHHEKSHGFMHYYQKYISSFDGPRCSLSPTCSGYAAQSFKRYGLVMGFIMAADRLMHEGDKVDWLKVRPLDPRFQDWQIGGSIYDWVWAARQLNQRPYFRDSLDDNSFWWRR